MSLKRLIEHYKMLWFLQFHRFEGDNYRLLRKYFAEVLIDELKEFTSLDGAKVLDVGGARGEFCQVLYDKFKCQCTNLDPCPGEAVWENTVECFAEDIPFEDNSFDVVICRGVIEHIPYQSQLPSLKAIYGVLKPGGVCYLMTQPWWNPHAGHQLKPFHVFPFPIAKFLRQLVFKSQIKGKSFAEEGLYGRSFRRWDNQVRRAGFIRLRNLDTHFRLHFMTRIPLFREFLVPSVAFILTKKCFAEKYSKC